MADRDLHGDLECSSTVRYAEDRLALDKRRVSELLSVGRSLLERPAIDTAFWELRIGWTKIVLLARVASPAHEEAWLEEALEKTTRKLHLREEVPVPMSEAETPEEAPSPEPVSAAEAFPNVAGQDAHVLLRLLASPGPHDVLFVDEVHAVPRAVLEALYEVLGEQVVSLTLQRAGSSEPEASVRCVERRGLGRLRRPSRRNRAQ